MEVSVDVNLNVKINEYGSNKEIDYFSTGYRDLIYICMRLSLIDSLFENEKPFIILDDPFVNLDEGKIANAIGLLNSLAKKYQIVYFVCHESRGLLYKKSNLKNAVWVSIIDKKRGIIILTLFLKKFQGFRSWIFFELMLL